MHEKPTQSRKAGDFQRIGPVYVPFPCDFFIRMKSALTKWREQEYHNVVMLQMETTEEMS